MRLASFSLLFIAATRAPARAAGSAEVSQTRFDRRGPFAQSGYLTPALAGAMNVAKAKAKPHSEAIVEVVDNAVPVSRPGGVETAPF